MDDLASLAGQIEQAERALKQEAEIAAGIVAKEDAPTLAFCRRLMAIMRVIGDARKGSFPSRGWRVIVISLLVKVFATVRSAQTLAEASHGREVSILVRSALESLITAMFVAKVDSARRAKRWAEYDVFLRARLLKKHPDLSKKPDHKKTAKRILAKAKRLEKAYPNPNFWASGLGKGSLRSLAEDVDMTWYYDFVYWSGSQATHASPIAVASYVDISTDGTPRFNMGLSGKHLGGELAVCCDLVVRGLALLNETAKLGIESLLRELAPEYESAFGVDPHAGPG